MSNPEDLIDLNSHNFSNFSPPPSERRPFAETSEHILDSEPKELERELQTKASEIVRSTPKRERKRKNSSVDVEDILICIEDDEKRLIKTSDDENCMLNKNDDRNRNGACSLRMDNDVFLSPIFPYESKPRPWACITNNSGIAPPTDDVHTVFTLQNEVYASLSRSPSPESGTRPWASNETNCSEAPPTDKARTSPIVPETPESENNIEDKFHLWAFVTTDKASVLNNAQTLSMMYGYEMPDSKNDTSLAHMLRDENDAVLSQEEDRPRLWASFESNTNEGDETLEDENDASSSRILENEDKPNLHVFSLSHNRQDTLTDIARAFPNMHESVDVDARRPTLPRRTNSNEDFLAKDARACPIPDERLERSFSCDDVEAMRVLDSLDAVLNAHLYDDDDAERERARLSVEECLTDLDNYLRECESASCDEACDSYDDVTEGRSCDGSDFYRYHLSPELDLDGSTSDEDHLRQRLRKAEVNYAKFLSRGVTNRAFVDTERQFVNNRSFSSACGRASKRMRKPVKRSATTAAADDRKKIWVPYNGTEKNKDRDKKIDDTETQFKFVVPFGSFEESKVPSSTTMYPEILSSNAIEKFEVPSIGTTNYPDVVPRTVSQKFSIPKISIGTASRTVPYATLRPVNVHCGTVSPSAVPYGTVMNNGTARTFSGRMEDLVPEKIRLERMAHASNDCCTGTVVVEPFRASKSRTSNSFSYADVSVFKDEETRGGTSWLRSSMRRLRRFRLPQAVVGSCSVSRPIVDAQQPRPVVVVTAPADSVLDESRQRASVSEAARPTSAPSRLRRSRSRGRGVSLEPNGRARSSSGSSRARRSLSSSESSLASSADNAVFGDSTAQSQEARPCDRTRQNDMPESESPLGQWPHSLSSMMACVSCTLGLFNISRFAVLAVQFGANFIFQFFLLSLLFGLPLFSLHMCLGQQLGSGVIDMWRISPLFQGVGVSLLIAQALIGLYSVVGVSWLFVYFRDSFITKTDRYRWAEPFLFYRDETQVPTNGTYKLSETVPDYFNGVVLQRHHLGSDTSEYSTIKFQLAFNLAVVWTIVFVALSKGLKSYGKVVYVFVLLPMFGTFVLCAKVLGMMPPDSAGTLFPETEWGEFFLNPRSWLAAAQEVFLTWGVLGAAVMQIASHNKHKHLLQRDSSLVAVIVFIILLLNAFLANTCVQILKAYGYLYLPDSFERINSYIFLRPVNDPLPPNLYTVPVRNMLHNSFIVGEKVIRPGVDFTTESGYQALRLATEIVPATFAVLGSDQISPFWAVLFYFVLILFGIAQQLAIWHCVITGIMAIKAKVLKSWETTITFFSCTFGFLLGLPMATEIGIYVVYFMDYTMGGIWWHLLIHLLLIIAVFMVRGRPYSGDTVVTALFNPQNHPCILSWAPALLSFTWNVILPVALMVLCITTFKNGNYREMFVWHHAPFAEYWPLWARQIGSLLQLLPLLCVPLVAVVQSYRYLNNGPSDILERIQLLYRPPIGDHMDDLAIQEAAAAAATTPNSVSNATSEDPPPKYTPPPSYTTATGARLAKFLRQSIRRSVRRLTHALGEGSGHASRRRRAALAQAQQPPPPDYDAVLVEMNGGVNGSSAPPELQTTPKNPAVMSTLERLRNLQPSPGTTIITAAEVASILRSSFRRSTVRRDRQRRARGTADANTASISAENLINSAAPIAHTSLVLDNFDLSSEASKSETENSSSVI